MFVEKCIDQPKLGQIENFKLAKENFFISDLYKSRSEHCTNSGFSVGTLYKYL